MVRCYAGGHGGGVGRDQCRAINLTPLNNFSITASTADTITISLDTYPPANLNQGALHRVAVPGGLCTDSGPTFERNGSGSDI